MLPVRLLLLHSIAIWAALSRVRCQIAPIDACANSCTGVSTEVIYEVGYSYVFDVTSRAILKIAQGHDTEVVQTAQAHISVHSPCEFSLKLTKTTLRGMDVNREWSGVLEKFPLRFAFDDGKVEAVCPQEGDPPWAVNVKRAVLSAFQVIHEGTRETDIAGDCPVVIEKIKRGATTNLKTTKQLSACYRQHDVGGTRAVPYRLQSKIQAVPMLDTKQNCERQVTNGSLQRVSCTEDFRVPSPLGKHHLGTLHVEQTLNAVGTARAQVQQRSFKERLSIVFDHSDDANKQATPHHAGKIIDELCRPDDRVGPDAASHFADLVNSLRGLSEQEIASLSNPQCGAFAEALAACASFACLAQLGRLINSGSASESIYSSLSLLSNPESNIVDSVATFIDRVPLRGLLSVSSLVHSYCITHPECEKDPSVQRIIHSIVAKLPTHCQVGERFEETEKTVIILKSIGNIGNEKQSLPTLLECIENDRIPTEVKLAAIEALRRKPCSQTRNSKLIEMYRDHKKDVEMRIESFRQLMECPSDEILNEVVDVLHNETVNQVGSYVSSFLNAKRRSTNPGSHDLQHILKRFLLPQRFNVDPRRFSRFYEFGYFDKENNYGGHIDSSIVYIPKGYIPREVAFNFTIHIFGKSMNILEIGVRAEGLEQAEEELFGADGYITNPNGHVFRERKFQSRYSKLNNLKHLLARRDDAAGDRVSATFYARVFGDDLNYFGFQKNNFLDEVKQSIELDKVLAKLAQEKNVKYSQHMIVFELSQTFPTLAGLPLQFLLNASLAIKMDGKMRLNLVQLLRQKGDADGLIDLRPSVSVSLGATVLLRAGHVASGALVSSNLYGATSLVRQMELRQGRKFSLKIDVPHKKLLVAKFRNDVVKVEMNRHQLLTSTQRIRAARKQQHCSGDTLAKILGVKACYDVRADFPVMEMSVNVEKVDPALNSYQLLVERASGRDEQKLLISVDTPGSQVDRKMEADFELSIPRKKLKMGVRTPFKKIELDGDLQEIRRLQDYAADLKLVMDNEEYKLAGTVKADKVGSRNSYKLNAKTVAGSTTAADLATEMQYSVQNPYAMIDFRLDKVFSRPVTFKTLINGEPPKFETTVEYSGPEFNGKLGGSVLRQGKANLRGTVNGEYQVGNQLKQSLEVALEQTLETSGTDHHFKQAAHAVSTSFEKMDFQVLSDRKGNNMKNSLEVNCFGKKSMADLDVTRAPNDVYSAVAIVKCDQLGVDTKADIVYQNRFPQQFRLKVDAETATTKDLHASAEYIMKVDPKWNFKGGARFAYPGREITLSEKIDEVETGKYKMDTHVQWDPQGRIDAISDAIIRPREHEYAIESTANVAGVPEPIYIKKYIKYQSDSYSIQWQARQGQQTIYELNGDLQGHFGAEQQMSIGLKSEKFGPAFSYDMTAFVRLTQDAITARATVHKDGRDFGAGNIDFPREPNLPNQKYRGEINWKYMNRPHKAIAEYNRQKNLHGSTYNVNVQSDDNINLSMQLGHHDKIHFKCDLAKNGVRTISTELTATPFKWDLFEAKGQLNTNRPLPKRSLKTKLAFSYRTDQANVEGFVETNGERYIVEGQWRKQLQSDDESHYSYSGRLETPVSRVHLDQQLQIKKIFSMRKAQTVLELAGAGKSYKLRNEVNNNEASFNSVTDLTGNDIVLKHVADYSHRGGHRLLKKHLKYNEKEINIDALTIYRDGEVKVDIDMSSTFQMAKEVKAMFGCRKGPIFWNCDIEGNINKRFVVKGHEMLSSESADIGYLVTLGNSFDNEGKITFDINNLVSKYNASALLRNADKKYHIEVDVTGNRGIVKLQTPVHSINDAQVRVIRKGPNEFELQSENEGRGKIYAHIKTGGHDKLFNVQITEIPEPFELHLANALNNGRQKSVAELTLNPFGQKRTYALENEIESERESFRAMRLTVKHPKRNMRIEVLRPTPNKYALSFQPHVGGGRRPTVAEMTYDKSLDGFHWEGTFSDQALEKPLKAKMDFKKNERDLQNYGIDLHTEVDYSGIPDKLFSNSFRIQRSVVPSGRRSRNLNAAQGRRDVRFEAELKSTHLASNLHARLWAKIHRREIGKSMIPVHASFGMETKNPHHQLVEYSVEANMDGVKFTEAQLKSPGLLMKTRVDEVSHNYYNIRLFKNNEHPCFVGALRFGISGAEVEFREKESSEVKFHASAVMPNDYEGTIDVWHSEGGRKIQDTRLSLLMDENNLLKGKAYLRPAVEDNIMKTAKATVTETGELGQSSFVRDALVPIFSSHKRIASDVMTALDRAVGQWVSEQRSFAAEFGPEFTSIVGEVEDNYELIKEAILISYDQAYQAVEQFGKAIPSNDLTFRLRQFRNDSGQLLNEFMFALKPVSDLLKKLLRELEGLQRSAANVFGYLENTLRLNDLRRAFNEYKDKFEQTDVIQIVLYEARKLSRQYQLPEVERAVASIETDRRSYETKALEFYKKIKDLLLDEVFVSALTKVTSVAVDSLDHIEVKKKWQEVMHYLRGKITAEELGKRFWKKYVPEIKRIGPGDYEVEVTVPYAATSLKDLLTDLHPQHFLTLKSAVAESVGLSAGNKEVAQSLLDTIYTYRPVKLDPWRMMPPFESFGYIIAGDHFISFDGRVFSFHARCEYLLASDLVDHRFALIAVFSPNGTLHAIKAELRGEEVLLHKNGKVEVNGAPVSMPWQKVDSMDGTPLVSVHRNDHWTVLETYDGLRMQCNSLRDICEFVLPGRMHGRSNGLLGSNDNEPSNDRDLVDGTHNDQLDVLAEYWAVNGVCRSNEARRTVPRADEHCEAYFHSSSSPLRLCFAQVRAKPFEDICSGGGAQQHCTAASAYFEVCSNAGIDTTLPPDCMKCANELSLGDEMKVEKPPAEHDVVFVVEESRCMENQKDKIARAAYRISQEQRSVRFGWVGFGGEGIHHGPHVHYEGGEALLDITSFSKQAQRRFEPVSGIEGPRGCAEEALHFAVKHFPFRFASGKSIVLVVCRKCSLEKQSEMLDKLLDQDITMHVLTLRKLTTSVETKAVGMDGQQLFDERGAQVGHRRALKQPNDACSLVAQQSYGTVFNIKQGFMVAASKVVSKKGSHCFNCQCTAHGLFARNTCRPCEAVEPAELASYGDVDSDTDSDVQLLDARF